MSKFKHKTSKAIRTQAERSSHKEHSVPLFMTSSYMFDSAEYARDLFEGEAEGNIYGRYTNPNVQEFIDKMCALESTEDGFATATGMSAVFVSMASVLAAGDHVLVSKSVFGSTIQITENILGKWGVEFDLIDLKEVDSWEQYFKPNTKMLVVETPTNPTLDLVDIKKVATLCKSKGVLFNVDNCFPTPFLQNPAELGADIVVHSATKFIDGQGRVMGGVVLGSKEYIEEVRYFCRHTGPAMSPFNAWVLSKSLETLAIRMEKHCSNALELATWLEKHDEVEQVMYPYLASHPQHTLAKEQMNGGGGLVSFILKGGVERGVRFLNSNEELTHGVNLGDTRTIITHPASTTHSKLSEEAKLEVGIAPGLIRVSVGHEHITDLQDILEDMITRSK